jgi:hypothetical protein
MLKEYVLLVLTLAGTYERIGDVAGISARDSRAAQEVVKRLEIEGLAVALYDKSHMLRNAVDHRAIRVTIRIGTTVCPGKVHLSGAVAIDRITAAYRQVALLAAEREIQRPANTATAVESQLQQFRNAAPTDRRLAEASIVAFQGLVAKISCMNISRAEYAHQAQCERSPHEPLPILRTFTH